eukprot:7959-Heterococcus_DN1.PRE.1
MPCVFDTVHGSLPIHQSMQCTLYLNEGLVMTPMLSRKYFDSVCYALVHTSTTAAGTPSLLNSGSYNC